LKYFILPLLLPGLLAEYFLGPPNLSNDEAFLIHVVCVARQNIILSVFLVDKIKL
jgi:hypothetical protein